MVKRRFCLNLVWRSLLRLRTLSRNAVLRIKENAPMATMGSYCKAYPATRLRQFTGWSEKVAPLRACPADGGAEEDNSEQGMEYFYLQENYTVTAGIFLDENIAFSDITPEWKDFCHSQLNFSVPAYVRTDDITTRQGTKAPSTNEPVLSASQE